MEGIHFTKNKGILNEERHPVDHLLSPPSCPSSTAAPDTPEEMEFDERLHDHIQKLVSPPTTEMTATEMTEITEAPADTPLTPVDAQSVSKLFTPQIGSVEYLKILGDGDPHEHSVTLPTIPWQQHSNTVHGHDPIHPTTRSAAPSLSALSHQFEHFMSPEVDYNYAAALNTQSPSPSVTSVTMDTGPSFPEMAIFKRFNSKFHPPPKRQSFNK